MTDYNNLCFEISKLITERYSTSFTRGIKTLDKKFQLPVFAVYGFVRLADEIVDTFHDYNKTQLLERFKEDTYRAIDEKISTNTVLHAFQLTVHEYHIERELIDAFLHSMEMDLSQVNYNNELYSKYIYGSAEVVGLMCLRIFTEGNHQLYNTLVEPARRLGAAFQKVNFLRDIKSDFDERGRTYFPGVDFNNFSESDKQKIEKDIDNDFRAAYPGMMKLPVAVQPGVYTAFIYYRELLKKIQAQPAAKIKSMRIRVPDTEKIILLARTFSKYKLTL